MNSIIENKESAARIIGSGYVLGSEIITNEQLCSALNVSPNWIIERTGIRERRKASETESTSGLGIKAALKALKSANLEAAELDAVICATITPDYAQMPSTACLIQAAIGADRAFAFDMAAACSGFVYGLDMAANFIKSGNYQNVLLVGADKMTGITDYQDLATSSIFADGAGAVVLSKSSGRRGILASALGSDGNFWDSIYVPSGGSRQPATCETIKNGRHFMKMRGRELFKLAVNKMADITLRVLEKADLTLEDVSLVIPHQANQRIIDAVAEKLHLPREKMFSNIEFIGNTTAATIPIALHQCLSNGMINRDDIVLFTSFGGGVTWGASVMRW